jgi:hypothetical protein
MLVKKEHNLMQEIKSMKKAKAFKISLLLLAVILPTATKADTIQRFIYSDISNTATLPKGKHELDYRFWLEDWDIDGWEIKVIRNDLTYRFGLSDRTEVGISQMHSSCLYWWDGYYYWGSISGFNDLQLYAKHQILREPDCPVTVSLGGRVYAPTGSTKGFSAEEWVTGEFVAVSKEVGSWRLGGHVGYMNYSKSTWADYYYWGAGAIHKENGLNLEIIGGDNYLQGLIGRIHGTSDGYIQYGLMIPMDGSDMDWRFILGLGFSF